MTRIYWLIGVCVLLAGTARAQEFPFKPLPQVKVQLTCGTDLKCGEIYHVKPKQNFFERLPVRRRTADWKWWVSSGVSDLSAVADVEYSKHLLGNCKQYEEADPIFGKCPSRLRYYSIMAPAQAFVNYIAWKYKREDDALRDASIPPHKYVKWHLINDLATGWHLFDISLSAYETRK